MQFVGKENYWANKFHQDGSYFWIMQFGFNKLWFELNLFHCNFATNSLYGMRLRFEHVLGERELGILKREEL
jgi:hypothetical protein